MFMFQQKPQEIAQLSLQRLIEQYMELHKPEIGHLKLKKLHISPYVDRQIRHLVVEEYFDFEAISDLMRHMFPEHRHKLTKQHCQERWTQMHLNRKHKIDQRKNNRQDKKLLSIMAFEDPKKLFTARELIEQLEIQEKKRASQPLLTPTIETKMTSFNVTRDHIRQKNPQELKKLQEDLNLALEKAKQVDDDMCDRPFLYRPKFICDNFFQLEKQDLTQEKAKNILRQKVVMNNYVVGQFTKSAAPEVPNYKSRFAHMQDNKPKTKSQEIQDKNVIDDNWDQYESDSDTEI